MRLFFPSWKEEWIRPSHYSETKKVKYRLKKIFFVFKSLRVPTYNYYGFYKIKENDIPWSKSAKFAWAANVITMGDDALGAVLCYEVLYIE